MVNGRKFILIKDTRDWSQAETYCSKDMTPPGTYALAKIASAEENTAIATAFLGTSYWLGGKCEQNANWLWVDGSTISNIGAWKNNIVPPAPTNKQPKCLLATGTIWADNGCSVPKQFVCRGECCHGMLYQIGQAVLEPLTTMDHSLAQAHAA